MCANASGPYTLAAAIITVVLPSVLSPFRWKPPPSTPISVSRGAAKAQDREKANRLLPTARAATWACHSAKVPDVVKSLFT
ncbi:hypothetical protein D3C86_1901810 [compost metagenome]